MHITIIGAGIVGLSTALHLRTRGADVRVLDAGAVGRGASWGNAGWVSPGLVVPLAEPGAWKHGISAFTDKNAPLSIPRITPSTVAFLAKFASHMTQKRFDAAIADTAPWTRRALAAYDVLAELGVREPVVRADYHLGADSEDVVRAFEHEVEVTGATGVDIGSRRIDPAGLPFFSERVTHGLVLSGQAFMDPGAYTADLARVAREAGVEIHENVRIVAGHEGSRKVGLVDTTGEVWSTDSVVVAAGAWSDAVLEAVWGRKSRTGQGSGRGYSFTAPVAEGYRPEGPVYLPAQRVVLTPYHEGVRVAGTMEFLPPDAPMVPDRIEGIVRTLEPYVEGVDLAGRTDEWVGPRPVSTDGRPILRRVGLRGYVCTGMGMWGIVLGAVAGERTADLVLGN